MARRTRPSPYCDPNWRPTPAPRDLGKVHAFVNTLNPDNGSDELEGDGALEAWLVHQGLVEAGVQIDEASRQSALDLRVGLRALIEARGRDISVEDWQRLNGALDETPYQLRFGRDGTPERRIACTGWPAARARLVDAVADAVNERQWPRFKICPRCGWIFYDTSTTRTGKWCSVRRCGNLANAELYRKRRKRGIKPRPLRWR